LVRDQPRSQKGECTIKLIIAGGRDIDEYGFVEATINFLGIADQIEEVVSGLASGIDSSGVRWGNEHGVLIKPFGVSKEDWATLGKSAGPIRNDRMAQYGTHLLLIWDGESRGSKSMREKFLKYHTLDCLLEVLIKGRNNVLR
jgi:hypothetical protein